MMVISQQRVSQVLIRLLGASKFISDKNKVKEGEKMEKLELRFTYGKENLVFCAQNTTWSDKDGWIKQDISHR